MNEVEWKNFFYPTNGPGANRAAAFCWGRESPEGLECPIRMRCLRHAIEANETLGVFGGYGQRDRVRIRKMWSHRGVLQDLPEVKVLVRRVPRFTSPPKKMEERAAQARVKYHNEVA